MGQYGRPNLALAGLLVSMTRDEMTDCEKKGVTKYRSGRRRSAAGDTKQAPALLQRTKLPLVIDSD